jgi:ankyrin repeat protein
VTQLVSAIPLHINFLSIPSNLLTTAAQLGNVDIVQLLLSKGAQIVTEYWEGNSELEIAAAGGHEEVVKLFLKNGADVNRGTGESSDGTALQCAAANGHMSTVQLVLERSANMESHGMGPKQRDCSDQGGKIKF